MSRSGIVAFAFGVPASLPSNRRISEITTRLARELNAIVYTQQDVELDSRIEVFRISEAPGQPPPSLRIARRAVNWAARWKLGELWIVAARPHLIRCLRDVQFAVIEAGISIQVHPCTDCLNCPETDWFCPDSEQSRTRSRKTWERRERLLRLMPFWLYQKIAG